MDTILPVSRRVDAVLTARLTPEVYGDQAANDRIVCRTDWQTQLDGDLDLLSKIAQRGTGGPVWTPNEFRTKLGLPPVEAAAGSASPWPSRWPDRAVREPAE